MAGFTASVRSLFPINNIGAVVRLFRDQLEDSAEPDLALLSIVVGAIENSITCRPTSAAAAQGAIPLLVAEPIDQSSLPVLELGRIEALYVKFHAIIRTALDPAIASSNNNKSPGHRTYATRELVKRVSDVVWNSLTRSYYKDRAHLQSLYSYLTGNKLDCFGVAFAVVAGCQVLGYSDVHLALSEDHAWVVFGERQSETSEVTWHGKGNEDKRGQEVNRGVTSKAWLYANNSPVICTRAMEVAALVSSINPSLTASHDASEVILLQQDLLWLLYDLGHLARYPMGIGNLGDLEEVAATPGRIPCKALFKEAVMAARTYYNNQHVYPYTYQGGYFYRSKMFKEAFESWANASDVIRMYNYSRDDEEIYKEFLEIANELIPYIMKVESSGFSANTILKKPECFAHLLRFYDGICQWEEGSATPVLHIGWAKPLVNTISKFEASVRAQVNIVCSDEGSDGSTGTVAGQQSETTNRPGLRATTTATSVNGGNNNVHSNNNNYCGNTANGNNGTKADHDATKLHPSLEALTAGCSEKILNRDYLLQGGGDPFVGADADITASTITAEISRKNKADLDSGDLKDSPPGSRSPSPSAVDRKSLCARPTVMLHSQKMKELKDLLLAEKLNTSAISLHLTAQSQVQVARKMRSSDSLDSAQMAASPGGGGANGGGTGTTVTIGTGSSAATVATTSGAAGGSGGGGATRPKRTRRE